MMKFKVLFSAALALFLGAHVAPAQSVKIDGSSTVYPVTAAVAEEFQAANPDAKVTVSVSGTGGGFKKFLRGETDITNASRPILEKEIAEAKAAGLEYIELPVAFDALTVVVNPKNTWADSLTTAELKMLWEPAAQAKINSWNQIRPAFPASKIDLFGAGTESGTFDYFTEAIVGKSKASRGDYTPSEDDNTLVQGVSSDVNALGYFGFSYYVENKDKLKAVGIDNGTGPVLPSEETVMKGSYSPLSRPIFIYVSKKSFAKPEVKKFVEFYLDQVPTLAKEVKYIPLTASAYEKVKARVAKGETGTAFAGHSIAGLHIDDLLDRPLVK